MVILHKTLAYATLNLPRYKYVALLALALYLLMSFSQTKMAMESARTTTCDVTKNISEPRVLTEFPYKVVLRALIKSN